MLFNWEDRDVSYLSYVFESQSERRVVTGIRTQLHWYYSTTREYKRH